MPTDPLTLVFMALTAVTSTLLYVFRQWMEDKNKSFDRLEKDCEKKVEDIKDDNRWLKSQLQDTQSNQMGTLNVMSEAVKTQGIGVKAILDLLQAVPRIER
jgi:hypothetical protein